MSSIKQLQPLNAKQQELLDAMRDKGVTCIYMKYVSCLIRNPFYFRTDTGRLCTPTARSLFKRGLTEKVAEKQCGDHSLAFKEGHNVTSNPNKIYEPK